MKIVIDERYAGKTIREVLTRELGYSSNLLKKLKFSEGGILVNGAFRTVRHVLSVGEELSLAVEDTAADVSPYTLPVELPIEILYEDAYVTAVNKPFGMPAHPSLGHQRDTVSNALAWRYRDKPYVFRPVNRLDRDTSGCMLTANTRDASYKMYKAMTTGEICKTYLAVLCGKPEPESGLRETYMHRRAESIIEREETDPSTPDAKIARTAYHTVMVSGGYAVVVAHPITGRTHQLRVQFAGMGCPIAGDDLYGQTDLHIARHALHAWKTTFPHPDTGERIAVTAPLPDDIRALLTVAGFAVTEVLAEAERLCARESYPAYGSLYTK